MGAWEWDITGNAVRWDDVMHQLFGIPPGSFGGQQQDFLKMLAMEDRARVAREMRAAVRTDGEFDGEARVVWPADQTVHILRIRSKAHCDENGTPIRVIGVAWDITERRRTERALAQERNLLTSLMDNLPDAIYFKDRESRFLAVNRSMAARFSHDGPLSMVGKTDFDFFTPEHAEQALDDERRILTTGEPIIGMEEKETWTDGRVTWASTTKMPLRDLEGKITGTFGLSRDVTSRKQAEAQLKKVAEELRLKNETLEQDLEMARELQSAMLPQHYPEFLHNSAANGDSAVHFYHFYHPSMAVSGDFFDVLKISDDAAGLFICDVMGHGVRAALVAATIRAFVSEMRYTWNDPAEFLAQLNRALRETFQNTGTPLFASAFYVVADLGRGELRYANAGHPHPLRVHHSVNAARPSSLNGCKPGPALGLFDDARYIRCHAPLAPHDVVLLFTDGLFEVEGSNGELYDYKRLLHAVKNRSELSTVDLCRGVIAEVQQFSANQEFSDDVCLVAMEIDRLANGAH